MQLEGVTQENTALVEAAAASSQSFQDEADRLTRLVARFQLAGEGVAPPRAASAFVSPRPRLT